ncbi:hypothetical protein Tco_0834902 [Tanacetum coccineum]
MVADSLPYTIIVVVIIAFPCLGRVDAARWEDLVRVGLIGARFPRCGSRGVWLDYRNGGGGRMGNGEVSLWLSGVVEDEGCGGDIMAASAITISSDSSDESVGSPPSRVILFGDIPTVIPSTSVVAPETSTIAPVISSAAPMVETNLVSSPTRLCGLVPYTGSDSDSPDEMSSPEHISPLPAISPFLCTDSSEAPDSSDGPPSQDPYVATVAHWRSRVTTHPLSSSEFPIALSNRTPAPLRIIGLTLLTARKRVGPLPTRRLASRHTSPRTSDHHSSSSSSSSDSSPVYCLGLDASDQAHSGSSTRDSSSGDSSERLMHLSSHSVGPSRKRCRSPVDSVPLSTLVTGSLAPTRADLLPPRKRFRDSYSSEANIEEDAEVDGHYRGTGVGMELGIGEGDDVRGSVEIDLRDVRDDTEEYEADASAGDTDKVGINPMTAPIVEEEIVEPAGEDSSDSSDTRDDIVRMAEMIYSLRLENLKVRVMLDIERERVSSLRLHITMTNHPFQDDPPPHGNDQQRVNAALEAHRVNRNLKLGNGNDNGNGNGNGNRNGNGNGNGNGNNGSDNGDCNENHNVNGRDDRLVARECTYQDFMKCQPLSFKEPKVVVVDKLRVKDGDCVSHHQLFGERSSERADEADDQSELTMMCTKMVPEEEDRVEKFIGGLPDNIQGNVIAAEPTRL